MNLRRAGWKRPQTCAVMKYPYLEPAARDYARLQELRRTIGIPLSTENGMVAAICSTRNTTLATRYTKDFVGLGIDLVDPWSVII